MKKVSLFILLVLSLWMLPQGLQAQQDPRIDWKQIKANGVIWLFDAKNQDVAEHYISQFEKAKSQVLSLFKEGSPKLTIVIADPSDLANGSARIAPYPSINLWPVLPFADSSIGEFSNSAQELLVHEYTHILNMVPVHGWMTPLSWIFGSITKPNMILPRWYTEGLATFTESYYSKDGGRLRSQHLEGIARSLTLSKTWDNFPLAQLNDYKLDWLGASRAYLLGGILWESIYREGGLEKLYEFNQSYSRRIPFFLDGVIEDKLGHTYNEQLERAYKHWSQKTKKQISKVRSEAHISGRRVSSEKGVQAYPSISPDGEWLAYISSNKYGRGDIYLSLRHPKKLFRGYKHLKVIKNATAKSITWNPAATGFVYEKLDNWDFYYNYYDLYFYDLRTRKSRRITKGERAHHTCFSPNGKTLYYLKNTSGTKQIIGMDWKTQKTNTIYKGEIGDNLQYLACPAENTVLFVEQKPGVAPRITRLDTQKKKSKILFDDIPVRFIRWTHKGLLFSSEASGIENLYLSEEVLGSRLRYKAVTNSQTRSHQGEIDPLNDDLYYREYRASGPKVLTLKGAQWESLPDKPPQVSPIFTDSSTSKQKPIRKTASANHKAKSFSPWRYLVPNHWIPFLYIVDGGTIFQASTSAGDPLGKNNYSITGQWDTLTKKPGVGFNYINNSTSTTLGLGISNTYSYFYSQRRTLHFTNVSGLAGWRLWFNRRIQAIFKWNYSALEGTNISIRQGPQLTFSYNNSVQRAYQISPEEGWKFQFGHKNYLADLGNVSYGETYAHLGTFWSSFVPKRHAFYLGLNASYAPKLNNIVFATSTLGGPFQNPQATNTNFLQRGYPTGAFVAKNMLNANLEYRFPLFSIFRGWTSPPAFFKNLQGNLLFDATSFDGRFNSRKLTNSLGFSEFGSWYTGYGLELHTNMTVAYHLPITLTLGLYYGDNRDAYGGFTTFFNVRL